MESFLHLHYGLHLQSFTKEIYGDAERQGYTDMGCRVYREPEQFSDDTQRKKCGSRQSVSAEWRHSVSHKLSSPSMPPRNCTSAGR
jgi:hypothetical protein